MEFAAYIGRLSPVQSDVVFLNAVEPLGQHETSFNYGTDGGCEGFQLKGYGFIGLDSEE